MNRSYLMVAGDKPKHLNKLPLLKCDTAMVNLEDGVFDKEYARELLTSSFKNEGLRIKGKEIVVRINPLDECGIEDIRTINLLKPNAIRVPKVRSALDVKLALDLIDKDIEIHLSIETKEALDNLSSLKLDDRVTTVYLGILDMLESLELPQSLLKLDNPAIEYILSKFLVDSKIAGFYPVSFTYQNYKNLEEFTKWCEKVKAMGYTAKAVISPSQVEIVNETFKPNNETLEKAQYIKKIFEESQRNGSTGFVDEKYGFIDEPIYKDALLILDKSGVGKTS
ncbi:MAG: aldolase/citrate lyase family protein [Campylobacterota bacterium]|nr:aldolase/citrate lyase family protein [Campylobacterota bacterium]